MYKVIERFMDLQDDNYIYEVGDAYPREGADPTLERIRELASNSNKIGKSLPPRGAWIEIMVCIERISVDK